MSAYGIFLAIILIPVGIITFIADWKYGSRLRRWWHNLTHSEENQISEDKADGFIYKRPINKKILMAFIIYIVQAVISLKYAPVNVLFELLGLPIGITMIIIGFSLAPWAYQRWTKRADLFEWADDISDGRVKFSLADWFKELIEGFRSLFKKWKPKAQPEPQAEKNPMADEKTEKPKFAEEKAAGMKPAEPKVETDEGKSVNPQELIDKFTGRF